MMTVSFHKFGDLFFPGTGDVKVILDIVFVDLVSTPHLLLLDVELN